MIKFRAWHRELNMMFEVKSLVFTLNLATIASKNDLFPSRTCSFDDIILMQSTGLFDKNGKEIFEGDVIEIKRLIGPRFLVKKHKKSTQFVLQANFGREYFGTFGQDELEVIGNIFENHDLLESVEE